MSDRPTRGQLLAQLADRCDEVSRLRAELARARAELDDWREISRRQLIRNAELARTQIVFVTEPKTTPAGLPARLVEQQAVMYRRATRPKGRG